MARGGDYFYNLSPSELPFDKGVYTNSCTTIPDSQKQQVVDILTAN